MAGTNGDGPCSDAAGERIARRGASMLSVRALPAAVVAVALSLCMLVASASALPDGRAYEQVSPSNKHGASVQPLGFGFQGPLGGIVESSESGERFTYVADSPVETEPEGNRSSEGN